MTRLNKRAEDEKREWNTAPLIRFDLASTLLFKWSELCKEETKRNLPPTHRSHRNDNDNKKEEEEEEKGSRNTNSRKRSFFFLFKRGERDASNFLFSSGAESFQNYFRVGLERDNGDDDDNRYTATVLPRRRTKSSSKRAQLSLPTSSSSSRHFFSSQEEEPRRGEGPCLIWRFRLSLSSSTHRSEPDS